MCYLNAIHLPHTCAHFDKTTNQTPSKLSVFNYERRKQTVNVSSVNVELFLNALSKLLNGLNWQLLSCLSCYFKDWSTEREIDKYPNKFDFQSFDCFVILQTLKHSVQQIITVFLFIWIRFEEEPRGSGYLRIIYFYKQVFASKCIGSESSKGESVFAELLLNSYWGELRKNPSFTYRNF